MQIVHRQPPDEAGYTLKFPPSAPLSQAHCVVSSCTCYASELSGRCTHVVSAAGLVAVAAYSNLLISIDIGGLMLLQP